MCVEVMELSVQEDHVHLVCSIPPKLARRSSWLKIFKGYPRLKKRPYQPLWARGYPTIGMDEDLIRRYVRYQEEEERKRERERDGYDLFS